MAKKIVLQNDIDQQCRKFFQLSFNFQFLSRDISRCLSSVSDAFRRSGGQTTIIKTCKMQARCLSDLTRTLADGSELLRIAKETMQNLDAVIRQEVNNADMPTVYGLSYGDATSDARVFENEKAYWDSMVGQVYVDIHNGDYDGRIAENTQNGWSAYDELQCVGYAWVRFKEISNVDPNFSCGTAGNIGNAYTANPNLECVTDINSVKIPSLAYHRRGSYGHVVCVENILIDENGNHVVYYTSANEPGKDGTLHSFVYEENPGMFEGYVQLKG